MVQAAAFAKAFGYDSTKSEVSEATVSGDTATVTELPSGEGFTDTVYTLRWDGKQLLISGDDDAAE